MSLPVWPSYSSSLGNIATAIVSLNEVTEIQSERMEGTRDIMANSALHLNIVGRGPTHDPEIFRQIDSLKKEIDKEVEAILKLNKDLRDVR